VPSAITPSERNYLVNPAHPDFHKINVSGPVDYEFDPRIIDLARG
jgi:RES domain-containing protein